MEHQWFSTTFFRFKRNSREPVICDLNSSFPSFVHFFLFSSPISSLVPISPLILLSLDLPSSPSLIFYPYILSFSSSSLDLLPFSYFTLHLFKFISYFTSSFRSSSSSLSPLHVASLPSKTSPMRQRHASRDVEPSGAALPSGHRTQSPSSAARKKSRGHCKQRTPFPVLREGEVGHF